MGDPIAQEVQALHAIRRIVSDSSRNRPCFGKQPGLRLFRTHLHCTAAEGDRKDLERCPFRSEGRGLPVLG